MNTIVNTKFRWWILGAALVALTGCGKSPPPQYNLNMVAMVRQQIPTAQQQEIANILEAMFGTPDDPYVLPDAGLDIGKIRVAAGPVRSDEFGKETGLYRRQCGHCHGTTGDGLGPTASILNPYPRDYRPGIFKFKSTERAAKPTDADLETVLRQGVPGTAMPSFNLLPDTQVKALVEYVKYLSLRGQTELRLIGAMSELGEDEKLANTRATLVDEIMKPLADSWSTAGESVIRPQEKPAIELAESVAKGREVFYGTKGNCAKCHGPSALGDGQTTDYDDWNKPVAELAKDLAGDRARIDEESLWSRWFNSESTATQAHIVEGLSVLKHDALPPRNALPRNLRQGIYRGGRSPLDLYRRIYAGINGMPMPGVGPASPGAEGTLSSDEIWSLVDYVQSLPYEATSRPPRQKVLEVGQTQF